MENLLLEPMYENIRHVLIDEAVALYWSKGEGAAFWTEWTDAEAREEESEST
ncbi:hypothetical protein EDB89DRAFT_1959694 [Lactarius sanguifluus]|nr:hypothetical protein EDB89DRAFT_1959694 [Lactarius sanguifluus]